LLYSDDKPEEGKHDLPERTSQNVERPAEEAEEEVPPFVQGEKGERANDPKECVPAIAGNVPGKRIYRLEEKNGEESVHADPEQERNVLFDGIERGSDNRRPALCGHGISSFHCRARPRIALRRWRSEWGKQ
jgi:hypothetical protein